MEKNKKFKSFFDNNLDKIDLSKIQLQLDLLQKRVKILEDKLKQIKANKQYE